MLDPSWGDSGSETPEWRRRLAVVLWLRPFLLVSFGSLGLTLGVLGGAFRHITVPPLFYGVLGVWLVVAMAFQAFARRYQGNHLYHWYVAYLLLEMVGYAATFHLLGGIIWVGFIGFVFLAVTAAFTLSPRAMYGIAGIASATIVAMTLMEANGWLPHHDPFAPIGPPRGLYHDPSYITATLAVIVLGCFGLLTPALRWVTAELRSRQRALQAANADLGAARETALRSQRQLAELNQSLESLVAEKTRQIEALGAIARSLSSSRQLHGVYAEVLEQLAIIVPFDEAVVAMAHEDGAIGSYALRPRSRVPQGPGAGYSDGHLRAAVAPRLIEDVESEMRSSLDRAMLNAGYRSSVRVPMVINGAWAGVLMVNARRRAAFKPDDLKLVDEVAHLLCIAIESATLYEELRRNAETDALTGLRNHRSMSAMLEREAARSRRAGNEFSILVLDIDNFKVFNDLLGHQAGDRVLRDMARILTETRRETDVAARIGGDEFHIALPDTDVDSAVAVAERIRARLGDAAVRYPGQDATMSVSIGVAAFPTHGESIDEVVRMADSAMYEVKRAGGNGVHVGSDANPSPGGRAISFGLLEMLAYRTVHMVDVEPHVPADAVAQTAGAIADELALPEEDRRALRIAAMGHRMGMFDRRLDGLTWDRLSPDERRLLAQRMELGRLLMVATPAVAKVLDAAYYHHDARGASGGDASEAMPRLARILAVAEAFVESTIHAGLPAQAAYRHLRATAVYGDDAEIVQALGRSLALGQQLDKDVA